MPVNLSIKNTPDDIVSRLRTRAEKITVRYRVNFLLSLRGLSGKILPSA